MKTLRKTYLESMERELTPMLENEKRQIVGGWDFGFLPSGCGFYFIDNDGNYNVYLNEVVVTGTGGGNSFSGSALTGSAFGSWDNGDDSSNTGTGSLTISSTSSTVTVSCECGACTNFDAMNNPFGLGGADKSNNAFFNSLGEWLMKKFILKHDPCCAWY